MRAKDDRPQCQACGEGLLTEKIENNPVECHGQTLSVPLHYSVCSHCGAELTSAAQAQTNKRAMHAAEKQALGLLGGAAVRAFRKQLCLNQAEAAQLFGGGKVGFSRYENDDIAQSQAMDSLLRLCMANPHQLLVLARIRQVSLNAQTLHKLHGDAHQQLLSIAPTVQKVLEEALAAQRQQRATAASNDATQARFAVTERSVWKVAA